MRDNLKVVFHGPVFDLKMPPYRFQTPETGSGSCAVSSTACAAEKIRLSSLGRFTIKAGML